MNKQKKTKTIFYMMLSLFVCITYTKSQADEIQNETFFKYINEDVFFIEKDAFVFKDFDLDINAAIIIQKKMDKFDSNLTLYFGLDKHVLTNKNKFILKKFMATYPKAAPLKILGYTCPLGADTYNKNLSLKRSKAVANFLQSNGFSNLIFSGKGECCLKEQNENKYKLNRRAEILYNSLNVQK